MSEILLRPAEPGDLPSITSIYGHHVRNGLASFELDPPGVDEMRRRHAALVEAGFPYFVAVTGTTVLGYAYAGPYRARPAYRYTVEDSIYVLPDAVGRGIGKALLLRVIEACTARGDRQMLAVIGDSGNAASIGLHAACGFVHTATLRSIGWKFGRWVDSVLMQRGLGLADRSAPDDPARV